MTGFFMFLHAVVSILLLVVILMQSGRGGGLTESFASAESMFGAQTNEFMIKATVALSTLFLVTCLGLAIVSSQKGKSLMSSKVAPQSQEASVADIADSITDIAEDIVVGGEEAVEAVSKELEVAADAISNDAPDNTTPDDQ